MSYCWLVDIDFVPWRPEHSRVVVSGAPRYVVLQLSITLHSVDDLLRFSPSSCNRGASFDPVMSGSQAAIEFERDE